MNVDDDLRMFDLIGIRNTVFLLLCGIKIGSEGLDLSLKCFDFQRE